MNCNQKELKRRYDDVEISYEIFKNETNIKNLETFYDNVFNFSKFIEENDSIKNLFVKLSKNVNICNIDEKFLKLKKIILKLLKVDVDKMLVFIREKEIVLPTHKDIINKYGYNRTYSPTPEECVGERIEFLKNKIVLKEEDVDIYKILDMVRDFRITIFSFTDLQIDEFKNEYDKYDKLVREGEFLISKRDAELKYLGVYYYEKLMPVWDKFSQPEPSIRSMWFVMSVSNKCINQRVLNLDDARYVLKEVSDYFISVKQVYNTILNFLDKKQYRASIWKWIINAFWKIVGLFGL